MGDISALWLEDLFKIYVGANLADRLAQAGGGDREITLDKGPHQGRPTRYSRADFRPFTEQQLVEVIRQKLQLKRQQQDVAVMGYYIRFVNDIRVVREERRRSELRNLIRIPRIQVTDNGEYAAATLALLTLFKQYEERVYTARRVQISDPACDRGGVFGYYSGYLESFYKTIKHIVTDLPGLSIDGARATMEVDFEVSDLPPSDYPATQEGQQAALRAWNALSPRQRSAAVCHFRELGDTLLREYLDMHTRRHLENPNPTRHPEQTGTRWEL